MHLITSITILPTAIVLVNIPKNLMLSMVSYHSLMKQKLHMTSPLRNPLQMRLYHPGKKQKGQRDINLKNFPQEQFSHELSDEELDNFYGKGNWRRMPSETYKKLRHEPESWTVEVHTVDVCVGTDGDHQDEFMWEKRPNDLLRDSIVTPSLMASILNVKYVNSSALYRIEQEFERNGVNISRQTMSNWIVKCAGRYFTAFVERMK